MYVLSKAAHSTHTAINQLSRVLSIIGVTVLTLMMLLTVTDVFMRYIFAKPVMGSVEITEFSMAVIGFCGLAWCAVKRTHAKVDLLVARFSPRTQAILDAVTFFLCLSVTPFVAWQGVEASNYARQIDKFSLLLEIPAFPFYLVLGIGFAVLSLVLLTLIVDSVVKAVRG